MARKAKAGLRSSRRYGKIIQDDFEPGLAFRLNSNTKPAQTWNLVCYHKTLCPPGRQQSCWLVHDDRGPNSVLCHLINKSRTAQLVYPRVEIFEHYIDKATMALVDEE